MYVCECMCIRTIICTRIFFFLTTVVLIVLINNNISSIDFAARSMREKFAESLGTATVGNFIFIYNGN